jgi:hypothetical protein
MPVGLPNIQTPMVTRPAQRISKFDRRSVINSSDLLKRGNLSLMIKIEDAEASHLVIKAETKASTLM